MNKREPATEWRSLGEIVRHLYVVKLRDDSNYDVLAFSNNIYLENMAGRSSTFYVQKQEIGGQTDRLRHCGRQSLPIYASRRPDQFGCAYSDGRFALMSQSDMRTTCRSSLYHACRTTLLSSTCSEWDRISGISIWRSPASGSRSIHFYNEHELKPAKVIGCLLLLLVALIYAGCLLWVFCKKALSVKSGPPVLPHELNRLDQEHSPHQPRSLSMNPKYVIVTPARDEEKYIESTIESVLRQTIRPAEWMIVDDGSTDRTGEIADRYAAQHSWIRVIHRENRGFRKSGGGVMEAFYDGYNNLRVRKTGTSS